MGEGVKRTIRGGGRPSQGEMVEARQQFLLELPAERERGRKILLREKESSPRKIGILLGRSAWK